MKSGRVVVILLAFTTLLVAATLFTEQTPGIPNAFNPTETAFQNQTHFLTFTGSDTPGENAASATAYYNAIDPGHTKRTFPEWLAKNGFIGSVSQWHPTGPQIIACDSGPANGCDIPAHDSLGNPVYGDNIINTDSHAIVLNAADLGFVRNQFVRCVPSCSAKNPIIYTYLENYPVNPFAASGNGGSGFPSKTGYPSTAEASAAIQSALNRPSGNLAGCDPAKTDTAFGCKISRIADVAFEWAPPQASPSSSTRYGQLYAYIFADGAPPSETIGWPFAGGSAPNVATKTLQPFHGLADSGPLPINSYTGTIADPFPPNLDFIGTKSHPGVCFICHGGKPQNLTASGKYPNNGNVSGFRYLPIDVRNMLFSSDSGPDQPATNGSVAYTDRAHQEFQIKLYNQAVLRTVPTGKSNDGTGATRVAHLREVIIGWYAGFPGDQTMSSNVQNADFLPQSWLEPLHGGTAPAGSENLYETVFSPNCRSCHFNRELSLDFGTAANFNQESDLLQLALLPECQASNPDPKKRPMPLALLTYEKLWQGQPVAPQPLTDGTFLTNTILQLKNHFGYTATSYCASNP